MEFDCEMFDESEAALDGLLGQAHWPTLDESAVERLAAVIRRRDAKLPTVTWFSGPCEVVEVSEPAPTEVQHIEHEPEVRVTDEPVQEPEPILPDAPPWGGEAPSEPKSPVAPPWEGEAPSEPESPVAPVASQAECSPLPENSPALQIPPATVPAPAPRLARRLALPERRGMEWLALAASVVIVTGMIAVVARQMTRPQTIARQSLVNLPGRAPTAMELWLVSPAGQKYLASQAAPAAPMIDPHQQKIASLCRRGTSPSLVAAMLHEDGPDSRAALLSALLDRPDGMNQFLDLVRNRTTRDTALNTLQLLPEPPTDQLLAQLDSPLVARRFAAAKSLGSLCHGQSLPTLKRMIETGNHQREALAVLSECKDSEAANYLHKIERSPSLASELKAVRGEMQQLF